MVTIYSQCYIVADTIWANIIRQIWELWWLTEAHIQRAYAIHQFNASHNCLWLFPLVIFFSFSIRYELYAPNCSITQRRIGWIEANKDGSADRVGQESRGKNQWRKKETWSENSNLHPKLSGHNISDLRFLAKTKSVSCHFNPMRLTIRFHLKISSHHAHFSWNSKWPAAASATCSANLWSHLAIVDGNSMLIFTPAACFGLRNSHGPEKTVFDTLCWIII